MLELKLNVISMLTFELSKESSECILFLNLSGVDLLLFYKKSVHWQKLTKQRSSNKMLMM